MLVGSDEPQLTLAPQEREDWSSNTRRKASSLQWPVPCLFTLSTTLDEILSQYSNNDDDGNDDDASHHKP